MRRPRGTLPDPSTSIGKFCRRVYSLAQGAGLSQKVLAGRMGVTPGTVRTWTNGSHLPPAATRAVLARVLECSPEYLSGESDDLGVAPAAPPTPSSTTEVDTSALVPIAGAARAAGLTVTALDLLIRHGRVAARTLPDGEQLVDLAGVLALFPAPAQGRSYHLHPDVALPGPEWLLAGSLHRLVQRVSRGQVSTGVLETAVGAAPAAITTALGLPRDVAVAYRYALDRINGEPVRAAIVWCAASPDGQWWDTPGCEALPSCPPETARVYERLTFVAVDAERAALFGMPSDGVLASCERHVYAEGHVLFVATILCPALRFGYWATYQPTGPEQQAAWPWGAGTAQLPVH